MSKIIPNTTPMDLQKLSTNLEANSWAVPPSGRKRSTTSNKAREKWQLRGKGDLKRPAESTHGEEEIKKGLARRARARNVSIRGATDDSPFDTNEKPFQYPAPNAPDYPMHSPSPRRISFADPGLQALPRLTAGATISPAQYPDYAGRIAVHAHGSASSPRLTSPRKRNALRINDKMSVDRNIRKITYPDVDNNDPFRGQTSSPKRKQRGILPPALVEVFGNVRTFREKLKATRKAKALKERRHGSPLTRTMTDETFVPICAHPPEPQDIEMVPVQETGSGLGWRSYLSMFAGPWREKRQSIDSTESTLLNVSSADFTRTQPLGTRSSFISDGRVPPTSSLMDLDDEHTLYILENDNPFDTPLPSATLSYVSMASLDDDSGSSAMDLSSTDDNILRSSTFGQGEFGQMFGSDHTSDKRVALSGGGRAKLDLFLGQDFMRYC